jgi:ABC-type bacteriocin/lantibiotic exporter with double-glycine peptidase domain
LAVEPKTGKVLSIALDNIVLLLEIVVCHLSLWLLVLRGIGGAVVLVLWCLCGIRVHIETQKQNKKTQKTKNKKQKTKNKKNKKSKKQIKNQKNNKQKSTKQKTKNKNKGNSENYISKTSIILSHF